MEASFKDCVVYCTGIPDLEGRAEVIFHSPTTSSPVEKIPLAGGLAEPVQRNGETAEVLGYLFIGAIGERKAFVDAEAVAFRSMAARLWPLLTQAGDGGKKKAA